MSNPYPFQPPRRSKPTRDNNTNTVNSDNTVDNDGIEFGDSLNFEDSNNTPNDDYLADETLDGLVDDSDYSDDDYSDDHSYDDSDFGAAKGSEDENVGTSYFNATDGDLDSEDSAYGSTDEHNVGNASNANSASSEHSANSERSVDGASRDYSVFNSDNRASRNVGSTHGAKNSKSGDGSRDEENLYDEEGYEENFDDRVNGSTGGKHRSEESSGGKGAIVAGVVVGLTVAGFGTGYYIVSNSEKVTVANAAEYIAYDDDSDVCEDFAELDCTVNWRFNNELARGELIEQSIAPKEMVSPGEPITLTYSQGREMVEVPNVVGLGEEDALEELYRAGLDVTQVTKVDANAKAGTVTEVLGAEPGEEVFNGTEIKINVANGNINIPDWTGKTREFVESQAEGLNVVVSFKEEESEEAAGTVISQSVKDESVSEGDAVEVVIAKSFDNEQVKIPKVLEKSEEQAQSILAEAGFRKITTVVVENTKVTERQVTQVIPKEGEEVGTDRDVTIIVSEPTSENRADDESNGDNTENSESNENTESTTTR